jgi:PAS domain S-box-containing protein
MNSFLRRFSYWQILFLIAIISLLLIYILFNTLNSINNLNPIVDSQYFEILLSVIVTSVVATHLYFGKRSEISARDSEKIFRDLYERSLSGIALTDVNGRFIEFNEAFRNICGYSETELKKLGYWELTPTEYMEDEALQLDSLNRTGHYGPYEKEYIRKDGSLIPIELNGMLINGGHGQNYVWSIVKDISDVKRKMADLHVAQHNTEVKLVESEARFISTIEQAAVGFALVTLEGNWLQVNRKICQIVGFSRDELLQKTFQEITHPDDLKTDLEYVRMMLAGKIDTYSMDKRYIRKNGTIVWIRLTVSLHKKLDDSPEYFISVIEDISKTKETESELKKLHMQTERLLSQQIVTQTVMALAHDLNQPLNAAGNYGSAALKLLAPDLLDKQKLASVIKLNVNEIQRAGDVLRKLIQSVNRNIESDIRLDLINLVHESILLFHDESYGAPVEIMIESSHTTISVTVKEILIRKALMNLFRNAQQAMETLNGDRYARKISVRITYSEEFINIAVLDNGSGISQEVEKELFKPFFSTKADGIGMGLAISRAMIESCGGKLSYSPVGGKTAFHISLPVKYNAGIVT